MTAAVISLFGSIPNRIMPSSHSLQIFLQSESPHSDGGGDGGLLAISYPGGRWSGHRTPAEVAYCGPEHRGSVGVSWQKAYIPLHAHALQLAVSP